MVKSLDFIVSPNNFDYQMQNLPTSALKEVDKLDGGGKVFAVITESLNPLMSLTNQEMNFSGLSVVVLDTTEMDLALFGESMEIDPEHADIDVESNDMDDTDTDNEADEEEAISSSIA